MGIGSHSLMDVDEMKYQIMILAETKEERDELFNFLDKNKFLAKNSNQQKIDNPDMLTCTDCKKTIPENVASYSQKFYGKHLCRDCQLKYQKKEE